MTATSVRIAALAHLTAAAFALVPVPVQARVAGDATDVRFRRSSASGSSS